MSWEGPHQIRAAIKQTRAFRRYAAIPPPDSMKVAGTSTRPMTQGATLLPNIFKVVALDVDGTIAFHDRLDDEMCRALEDLRCFGVRIAVATGRTLKDLDRVYPRLRELADVLVAENGAVLADATGKQLLATPVHDSLRSALVRRGIDVQVGEVILACSADHLPAVSEEIARLGVGSTASRNRGSLMILPAGVTKGSGLSAAVDRLGLSTHNVLAVGDAENDHPLFSAAEYAVAVADAMPALRDHADQVLSVTGSPGTRELLRGPIATGTRRALSERRFLQIGRFVDTGMPATVPGSQTTVLITGASGRGKSHLAGLFVEQAVRAGYRVLLVDPEGDHAGLGELRNFEYLAVGPTEPFIDTVKHLLSGTSASVGVGLVGLTPQAVRAAVAQLAMAVRDLRAMNGSPHWVVFDEAHVMLAAGAAFAGEFDPVFGGHVLVTYQPELLAPDVMAAVDVVLSVSAPVDNLLGVQTGAAAGISAPAGVGSLLRSMDCGAARTVTFDRRSTPHIRHRGKYGVDVLPEDKWFRFRGAHAQVAGSLVEFDAALAGTESSALQWHLDHGDFSRWIRGALQDAALANLVSAAEREAVARRQAELEHARGAIRRAVRRRYLGSADDAAADCGAPVPSGGAHQPG